MPPRRTVNKKRAPVEADTFSLKQMVESLASALVSQAVEPNMLGYVPHAKQILFHSSTARGRLYIGGNRSGKTTGGVIEDLWHVTGRHPYKRIPSDAKIRGRAVGVDFTSGVEQYLLPQFKRWILPSDLVHGSWDYSWNQQEKTLSLANGSFIDFKSYDQDLVKHAGTSRHFVHFDEEPPKAVFAENLMRLIDTGGCWYMTMTPVDGMTWVYDELYEPGIAGTKKDLTVIKVDMDDNPYLTEEDKEAVLGFLDEDDKKIRKEGDFLERGGLIFKDLNAAHIIEESNWQVPIGWRVYMSVDHGINNPTAILWHAVSPASDVVTFGEYYQSDKIIKDHVAFIKDFERKHHIKVYMRTGDPAMKQRNGVTGTSILQAYQEEGIYLAVDGVPREVLIGINKMKQYLKGSPRGKPFWQITRGCPNLLREAKRYHWKKHVNAKLRDSLNKPDEPHKKDDHALDSTRYFFTLMPDLSPDVINKLVDMFEVGSLSHSLKLMEQAPDDAFRPVKWKVNTSFSLESLSEGSENYEGDD